MTIDVQEKLQSQAPLVRFLVVLGFEYLSPQDALAMRGGKTGNLLLEGILRAQLVKLNSIKHKGAEYQFSEANIQEAIDELKTTDYGGLQQSNEAIYDLLTLGTSLEQSIEGSLRSYGLRYVDWETPENNVYHVVPEFMVERSRSSETVRLDAVLFINGIPVCVIESKSPSEKVEQAISQMIRNQASDYVPKLFSYVQLVMAVNKNAARYGTVGSSTEFWGSWNELDDDEDLLAELVNAPLAEDQKAKLYGGLFANVKDDLEAAAGQGHRMVTEQDKAVYSLCRPERLLELIYRFTLVEHRQKKIARYQQFFVVRAAMNRIRNHIGDGNRTGGIIWHSQGSGKSLTMVMLARSLALATDIKNPRIVLVTDRDDLDKQLGNTFENCGLSKERATSGRNLVKHLKNEVGIITTLIHKFDKGWEAEKFVDDSPDIFVLVDESHRTNFGMLAARMQQMLPNACFIGFTGTPLLKEEKNSFVRFGGLIEPHYSIRRAVADKAVLPLLYEGRHVDLLQEDAEIDRLFEHYTADLPPAQQADLKRKYAKASELNKSDQVIYRRALDISQHYRKNWQGKGFKAQLVAPNKKTALKYHDHLNEIGSVSSEVVISPPDVREGYDAVDEGSENAVVNFWNKMMKRFGTEAQYTGQLIEQFKSQDTPEILIVVDKLLTGFDAPRNTVLYLCRKLQEHTLLQAIARVNRLHEGKDFGYIVDYESILGELDQALTMYDELEGFDEADLKGALISINSEIAQLPQKHSTLWDVFSEVANKGDEEAYEVLLADEEKRAEFKQRLTAYSKTLAIALSASRFVTETDDETIQSYKDDLKFFQKLRIAVRLRYAEGFDASAYEPVVEKLLDTHIQAKEAISANEPVDIFDELSFSKVKEGKGIFAGFSDAARADAIAHETKRRISERMAEDPAFYEKFSNLIQQAIDGFKQEQLTGWEYLQKVSGLRDEMVNKPREDVPVEIRQDSEACAYYGVVRRCLMAIPGVDQPEPAAVKTARAIKTILEEHWKVNFWHDADVQNKVKNGIDDFLYDDLEQEFRITLAPKQKDEIIESAMQIARNRPERQGRP